MYLYLFNYRVFYSISLSLSLTHSLLLSYSLTHTLSLSYSLTHTLSLTHTHSHAHSLKHALSHTQIEAPPARVTRMVSARVLASLAPLCTTLPYRGTSPIRKRPPP